MMASQESTTISTTGKDPRFDEHRWVIQIRHTLEEELEEDDGIAVSVFSVPKTLLAYKPEAYIPQFIAIGPYHHWRAELFEMERHKLTTARRTQKQLHGIKLGDVVDKFTKHESRIRAYYHRYLDFTGETLTWMMLVDACFLKEFLEIYAMDRRTQSKSHLVDHSGKRSAHNIIMRDLMMLENQIPLFLLKKIMELQHLSSQVGDDLLSKMLTGLSREVSPFKTAKDSPSIDVSKYSHLLEVIYRVLVPKPPNSEEEEEAQDHHDMEEQQVDPPPPTEKSFGDSSKVKQIFQIIWSNVPSLNGAAPVQYMKRLLMSRPMKLVGKMPLKIITNIPGISAFKGPIENFFSSEKKEDSKSEDSSSTTTNIEKPPLVEEIMIPSVTELVGAGVRINPTANGELTAINFDQKTTTLYLPVISLDVNSEVVLRNLVAYEAAVVPGALVFTRYTELMNGIIDTEEDVKVLRKLGIVSNHMKSDGEVADLWNGMSKSVKLTKVPFLDKTIEDVNRYYNSRWRVKSERFMKTYVFGCWPILTFLAAVLLLLLNGLQAFCSVYSCGHWLRIPDVVVKQ